ncbi:hypothetical protein BGZ57DRAFT_711905, partial [Hyaloscypha finlandica]
RIIYLDKYYYEIPLFSFPYIYISYLNIPIDLLIERVKDTTIIITTRVPLS